MAAARFAAEASVPLINPSTRLVFTPPPAQLKLPCMHLLVPLKHGGSLRLLAVGNGPAPRRPRGHGFTSCLNHRAERRLPASTRRSHLGSKLLLFPSRAVPTVTSAPTREQIFRAGLRWGQRSALGGSWFPTEAEKQQLKLFQQETIN